MDSAYTSDSAKTALDSAESLPSFHAIRNALEQRLEPESVGNFEIVDEDPVPVSTTAFEDELSDCFSEFCRIVHARGKLDAGCSFDLKTSTLMTKSCDEKCAHLFKKCRTSTSFWPAQTQEEHWLIEQ